MHDTFWGSGCTRGENDQTRSAGGDVCVFLYHSGHGRWFLGTGLNGQDCDLPALGGCVLLNFSGTLVQRLTG